MSNYGQSDGQGGRYGQYNPYAQQSDQYQPTDGYGQQPRYGQEAGPQQPGYGQQAGYTQQGPYEQPQTAPMRQQASYGQQQTGVATRPEAATYPSSTYAEEQSNNAYEMGAMNGQNAPQKDPNAVLNACREIDRGIDSIEAKLKELANLQAGTERETGNSSALHDRIRSVSTEITAAHSELVAQMKKIIRDPESGSPRSSPQVGRVKRRLQDAIRQYQKIELDHRNHRKAQIERAIRITNPDATEAEVRDAVEDPEGGQVFANSLMDRDRRGRAQTTLSENKQRHKDIQDIEKQMMMLAQLFQDLDALVIQQEAAVENIDQRGEEVQQNVEQANVQLDGAVKSANAARKKKWICLGIAVLIIIIIVVVVVVVVLVLRNQNSTPAAAQTTVTAAAQATVTAAATTTAAAIRMVRGRELDPVDLLKL